MSTPPVGFSRFALWFACAFHLIVGLALNLDLGLKQWVASSLYGATVDWSNAQFVYILKPLGVFMIALGFMAALAARDPVGRRGIIYVFSLLFFLRALQRLVFLNESSQAFTIPPGRTLTATVVMLLLSIVFFYIAKSAGSGSRGRAAA